MRRILCFICVVFVLVCFAAIQIIRIPPRDFSPWEWEEITVTGRVVAKERRASEQGETLLINVLPIARAGEELFNEGKVLCYLAAGAAEPLMGSLVQVNGKLKTFERATNPGQFSADEFYQIMNTDFRLYSARVLAMSAEHSPYLEALYRLKSRLSHTLDGFFNERDASVLKTMLLGERGQTDAEIKSLYQRNGIVHILTISGLHISIIGMSFYRLLRRIMFAVAPTAAIAVAAPLAIVVMYSYGLMTDMSASSIRAIVMFALRMAAGVCRRTYDLLTALAVAAALLLFDQPLYLKHSGFLFSFLAVLAIGLVIPAMNYREQAVQAAPRTRWQRWAWRISAKAPFLIKVKDAALSCFVISTFTLPVYFVYYYEFPLYSILLNLVIIPPMSLLMVTGILTMTAGAILAPLGRLTALVSSAVLWFYEKACLFCDGLPGSSLILGSPKPWQLALFAAIVTFLVFAHRRLRPSLRCAVYMVGVMLLLFRAPSGDLTVAFLDVGQGDAIFIATPDRRHYLIDGGSSSVTAVGEYRLLPFLKSQGVSRLDGWFVTHPDADHCSGFPELVARMERGGVAIENLLLADIAEDSRNEDYRELVRLAEEAGIAVRYIGQGVNMAAGEDVFLRCLAPQAGSAWPPGEANAYSLVLRLEYGGFSLLLTGDVEKTGEEELKRYMASSGLANSVTVLKVAHHGSRNSTDAEFLGLAAPDYAVISAGRGNSYGHPHRELLGRVAEAGAEVYITYESGAVIIETDGVGMRVVEWGRR
ncbi:MAG: DNA internalization-related competence protein ComEC/Rec2 [Lachnospiraceae bacterium]|nr:DNA internalization-related competence protein ComEC/Rec2 [Lachnospiraceae bacterium]